MNCPAGSGRLLLALGAALLFAACGGGGGGGVDTTGGGGALVLVDVSVSGTVGVPLNEIFVFEFSADVDPSSVRPDTMRVREGPDYGKQVPGYYRVLGNRVEFYPRLPVMADLSDSGLQPGRAYRLVLPGYPEVSTVKSTEGKTLLSTTTLDFETAQASSPNIFVDNFLDPIPPRIVTMNPPDGAQEVSADAALLLTFNRRPLHPGTVSTSNIRLWMESRRGEVVNRAMPIIPVLIQSYDSVQVRISPVFPLADEAVYRVEVDRRVQDLVGNDVEPPAGQSSFVSRFGVRNEPFRYSALTVTFNETEKNTIMDAAESTASWNEAVADALAALFTVAGGNGTAGDLKPTANQNFTPEDFKRGVDVMVLEGIEYDVYNFRAIDIPAGVTIRFSPRKTGPSRPARLLSLKSVTIAGVLQVSGGDGEHSQEGTNYTNSALPLSRGGKGGPGGGSGSDNTTSATMSPIPNHDGQSVVYGGGGGEGGGEGTYSYSYYSGTTYYYRYYYSYCAGGGGGGGSRTPGTAGKDGNYPSSGYYGKGGKGGQSTTQRGYAYNLERTPNVGGAGGGAGGRGYYDYYYYTTSSTSRTQYLGAAGAGGGGGGGITVQSAGDVTLAGTSQILSNGGNGGNSMTFYAYAGAAGGGGAGGGVKVVATGRLKLDAGAKISVAGGVGGLYLGTYTYYGPGPGGTGGTGYIRFEALEDENAPGKPLISGVSTAQLTYAPPSEGTFAPQGGGAPSIGQTTWLNLGVFDPQMFKPSATDVVATLYNGSMSILVQMAIEDPAVFGRAFTGDGTNGLDLFDRDGDGQVDDTLDPTKVSEWTPISSIESLNGYHFQFIRMRVIFQLNDKQVVSDPLPFLDSVRLPFGF